MRKKIFGILALAVLPLSAPSMALVIDNDIAVGTLGSWSVDVTTGGESKDAILTANKQGSGLIDEDVLFDYFSYVDIGGGGIRLSGTDPVSTGDDAVQSTGTFIGAGGNIITWIVDSFIPDGGDTMTSIFSFMAAENETLGEFRFYQYMDEDLEIVDDDVLVTRGSAAASDLQLYTLDNTGEYGVSHSGALSEAQGLVNSSFAGWAADQYSDLRSAIIAGSATVSLTGVVDELDLIPITHPTFGAAWGPADITSVLAWDVVATANSATIITTLGGLADIVDLPPVDPPGSVPVPATLALFGLGLAGLGWTRRKKA